MNTVYSAAIWAGALLIIFLFPMLRFSKQIAGLLEAKRVKDSQANDIKAIELRERQHKADVAAGTVGEEAELKRAELRRKAAEADAAAQVAQETTADRIEEERKIIAARAEGRAARAHEEGLAGTVVADQTAALVAGYEAYCKYEDYTKKTFAEWLGVDGRKKLFGE